MSTQPNSKPPKTMSSKLLTMKFMQRAAASHPSTTNPLTPTSPSSEPSSKRRKISNNHTPNVPNSDLQAVRAAVAAEEAVRSAAIEKQAAEAGETRWVFSFQDGGGNGVENRRLKIVEDGFAGIDSGRGIEIASMEDEEDEGQGWREKVVGRRSFGRFNRALEKSSNPTQTTSPTSSSTSSSSHTSSKPDNNNNNNNNNNNESPTPSDAENPSPTEQSKAATRALKKRRKAEREEAKTLAKKRKSKEVKLNTLTSISGGGNMGRNSEMTCFNCGKKGHGKNECVNGHNGQRKEKKRHAGDGGDGKVKKRKKSG
ncbi:MAG: hypothetical protein M1812_001508 [Candelaria pacifica]|nr:MAG: hypothetical protein M1812_001508 [Candelaria pacifica]